MALRAEEKPMLPLQHADKPRWYVPCAADAACRKPGRMWVDGMGENERICIEHYYAALERGKR